MRLKIELNGRTGPGLGGPARAARSRTFAPEGFIGLQNHDSQSPPFFRNVYLKEL